MMCSYIRGVGQREVEATSISMFQRGMASCTHRMAQGSSWAFGPTGPGQVLNLFDHDDVQRLAVKPTVVLTGEGEEAGDEHLTTRTLSTYSKSLSTLPRAETHSLSRAQTHSL